MQWRREELRKALLRRTFSSDMREIYANRVPHFVALHHTPVERLCRKGHVPRLVEEDYGPDAGILVMHVAERMVIPLDRVAARSQRAELGDHHRLPELLQRRIRLLDDLVEGP